MSLQIRRKSPFRLNSIATLMAVFALVVSPMYGVVSERVAKAAPSTESTETHNFDTYEGGTSWGSNWTFSDTVQAGTDASLCGESANCIKFSDAGGQDEATYEAPAGKIITGVSYVINQVVNDESIVVDTTPQDTTKPTADLSLTGGHAIDGKKHIRSGDKLTFKVSNIQDPVVNDVASGPSYVSWSVFKLYKNSEGKTKQKAFCNTWSKIHLNGATKVEQSFKVKDLCNKAGNEVKDGTYAVAVRVYDNAGNYLRKDNINFVVDATQPTLSDFTAPTIASKQVSLSAVASDEVVNDVSSGIKGVSFWIAETNSNGQCKNNLSAISSAYKAAGTEVDGVYSADINTKSLDYGTYCVLAQAEDGVKHHSNPPKFKKVTIDNTNPEATLSFSDDVNKGVFGTMPYAPGLYARNSFRVIGSASDNAPVKKHWFEVTATATGTLYYWYDFNSATGEASFDLRDAKTSDGEVMPVDKYGRVEAGDYKVRYVATDQAGNRSDSEESLIKTVSVDYSSPLVRFDDDKTTSKGQPTNDEFTVGYEAFGSNLGSVYVAVYDDQGIKRVDRRVESGGSAGFTDGKVEGETTFSASSLNLEEGRYRLEIRASNYNGTWKSVSDRYVVVDTKKPVISNVSVTDSNGADVLSTGTLSGEVTIKFDLEDTGTGVDFDHKHTRLVFKTASDKLFDEKLKDLNACVDSGSSMLYHCEVTIDTADKKWGVTEGGELFRITIQAVDGLGDVHKSSKVLFRDGDKQPTLNINNYTSDPEGDTDPEEGGPKQTEPKQENDDDTLASSLPLRAPGFITPLGDLGTVLGDNIDTDSDADSADDAATGRTDGENRTDSERRGDVAGAADDKDGCYKLLGLCWYYWVPIVIVVAAIIVWRSLARREEPGVA